MSPTSSDTIPMTDAEIEERYEKREKRILTEINREKLPSFAEALKKPNYMKLRPFYQRRDRWDAKKQSRLIESFLINIPVPPIILYEETYNSYEVMDGQQRITAIRDFYKNELKLTGLEIWPELNGRSYEELPNQIKAGIDRRSISSIVLITESTHDREEALFLKRLAFERLNTGGVTLSRQEIRNCLYGSKFNELLFKLSSHPLFVEAWGIPIENQKDCEQNNLYKKMEDVELVLRFFALRDDERITGGLSNFLDSYMIEKMTSYESTIEELRDVFEKTIKTAYAIYKDKLFKPYDPKLNKWKKDSYKAYYDAVMVGFSRHINNSDILIPQKLRIINQNLRKETLEKLLNNAGIPNSWKWIQINRHIKNFIEYTLGEENTVEGQLEGKLVERQLKEFVNYRNDAAHGALIYNVLSSQKLLNLCDFIDVFCQAITELVTHKMVIRQESMRQVKKIGKVTRWFSERKATHAKVKETTIFRGCNLFLVSETKAYCKSVKVISIMVEKDEKWLEKESIEVSREEKIGLKFDCDVIKDLDIFKPIEKL